MSTAARGGLPIGVGAGIGAAAWVVGAVLTTFIAGQLGISQALLIRLAFAPLRGTLTAYIDLHTWFLSGFGRAGIFVVLMLIPIVLLVGAGFYVASQCRSDDGFATGASVAVGYLAMTILSMGFLLVMSSGMTDVVDFVLVIVVTGIVFPVLFGGIGGLVANQS